MMNIFPSSEDWIGGSHGIHLLQEYYNLSPSVLANGTIQLQNGQTYESDFTMGIEEMYQIGISSLNERYYDTGIEWMEMALKKYQDGNKIIVTNDYLQFWANFEWFLSLFQISDVKHEFLLINL